MSLTTHPTQMWILHPTYCFSAHDVPEVDDYIHVRCPGVKLPLPGGECGQRHHNQEGSIELMLVEEIGQKGDGLDGLPQSHLVSKYNTVAPEETKKKKSLSFQKQLLFGAELQ